VSAQAQQPAKVAKIGWIRGGSGSSAAVAYSSDLFKRELSQLGYIEGKNITIEYRSAENQLERFPALVQELIGLKVEVLVSSSTAGALAAKNATQTIPIVFIGATDPIGAGLVDSLARPGGNITGFTTINALLTGKRLELLKETIPKLSHVALLWNPQDPASAQEWTESQSVARKLGLRLYSMEASSAEQYDLAFKEALKARVSAVAVPQDPLVASQQKQIVRLAARHRLPAIYSRHDFVESGGLMSYGPDPVEPYKRAAILVVKIIKGTKPADLPVEQPTKFEFIVNLKAAKQIDLTIPPNVLARADKVIR
jgi:putative ABC transport system substrate-binding protein